MHIAEAPVLMLPFPRAYVPCSLRGGSRSITPSSSSSEESPPGAWGGALPPAFFGGTGPGAAPGFGPAWRGGATCRGNNPRAFFGGGALGFFGRGRPSKASFVVMGIPRASSPTDPGTLASEIPEPETAEEEVGESDSGGGGGPGRPVPMSPVYRIRVRVQ